jgi:hypothetical protein
MARFPSSGWTDFQGLHNMSGDKLRKETDLAWEMEAGAGTPGRRDGGEPEPPAVEDERFLDHHIEEILDALSHTVRTRRSGLVADTQPRE